MLREIKIDLQYQNAIPGPPPAQGDLHQNACRGDNATIAHWREAWLKNCQANKERFKSFAEHSVGKLHGLNRNKPAIICGSGPSLKHSIEALKENAEMEHPLLNVSCLHNFGYFEDNGFHADFYLSLDAGEIVLKDVFESRDKSPEHYWEQTKGKKLLASVLSPPKLFDLWQGEIYLFHTIIPEPTLHAELQAIESFRHYFSCGGNALGACFYAAKCLMSSDLIHFVGADFCFDYDDKFHSYATAYDKPGGYVMMTDVFGMPRKSWPSYLNFKFFFDWVACNIPGRYVNCSEGLLGAYKEGNIQQFQYMSLKDALLPYKAAEKVYLERRDPQNPSNLISKDEIRLRELFADPTFKFEMALI